MTLLKLALIFCSMLPMSALAKTDNEMTSWNTISIRAPLEKIHKNLFLRETISQRFLDEFQALDITLIRSELQYLINDNKEASFGYDFSKRYNSPSDFENRLWQQSLILKDIQRHSLFLRTRFEQRFIDDGNFILRLRTGLGYSYQLTKTVSITLSDELFFNLNSKTGFEQNRVLLSLEKSLNENLRVSLAYQLQSFLIDRDLINHVLMTGLQVDL